MIQGREPQTHRLLSGSGPHAESLSLGQLISAKCMEECSLQDQTAAAGKEQPQKPCAATRTPEMFKHRTLMKQRVSQWQPAAPEFKSRSHPHQEKWRTHCTILTQWSDAQSRGTVIELAKITLGVSNISLLWDNWSLIHRSLSTVLMISSMWFHEVSGI